MKSKRKKNYSVVFFCLLFIAAFVVGIVTHDLYHNIYSLIDISSRSILLTDGVEKNYLPSLPKTYRVPILMYHYVEYVTDTRDTIRKSLDITPYTFEHQIKTLQDVGYTFITMKDLADSLDFGKELPEKSVILTFDDGYLDFYTDVFPILKKYQVKATAYIVPDFIDKLNYMFSWQIHALVASGLVEIGAHSMHHVNLKGLEHNRARTEIYQSKQALEGQYGIRVSSFAYPFGAVDRQAMSLVKNAGFRTAVSTTPGVIIGRNNRYDLFRIRPYASVGEALISYLNQSTYTH